MLQRLCIPLAVAFALGLPTVARAQMGGGDDEKKDEEPKKEEPKADPAKPDAPKPDAPKPDAPKDGGKTVGFDKPASWKDSKGSTRGAMKASYGVDPVEGDTLGARAMIIFAGTKSTFDKELERWASTVEDKDGKKIDKSTLKPESFEVNGIKVKVVEIAGMIGGNNQRRMGGGKKGDKGGDKGDGAGGGDEKATEKKPGKFLNAYVEAPDGAYILRLSGGEKTVDKNKDDFMKWVKSAKIVDKKDEPKEEAPPKRKKPNE